jgi:hypothetical protein
VYVTPDSGGECGVPYESYFRMPAVGKDKPWYSIEQGSVHFIIISTEHKWSEKSEQVYCNVCFSVADLEIYAFPSLMTSLFD